MPAPSAAACSRLSLFVCPHFFSCDNPRPRLLPGNNHDEIPRIFPSRPPRLLCQRLWQLRVLELSRLGRWQRRRGRLRRAGCGRGARCGRCVLQGVHSGREGVLLRRPRGHPGRRIVLGWNPHLQRLRPVVGRMRGGRSARHRDLQHARRRRLRWRDERGWAGMLVHARGQEYLLFGAAQHEERRPLQAGNAGLQERWHRVGSLSGRSDSCAGVVRDCHR